MIHGSTKWVGAANLLLVAVGVGMLALPGSIAKGGYVPSIILMIIEAGATVCACFFLNWSITLSEDLEIEQSRRQVKMSEDGACGDEFAVRDISVPSIVGREGTIDCDTVVSDSKAIERVSCKYGYEELGRAAFGANGHFLVCVVLHIAMYGTCCLVSIVLGEKLFHLTGSLSRESWTAIAGLSLLPVAWLRTTAHFGYVAVSIGTVAVFGVVGLVTVTGFLALSDDYISSHREYSAFPEDPAGLGATFASMTFAFALTCATPTVLIDLKNRRKDATFAILLGVGLVTVVYALFGFASYGGWGQRIGNYSQVVNAIDADVKNSQGIVLGVSIMILTTCVCHFAAMLNPTSRFVETGVLRRFFGQLPKENDSWPWPLVAASVAVRTVLVFGTVIIAIFVARFKFIVDLIGAVFFAMVHFVFPPLFYLALRRKAGFSISSTKKDKAILGIAAFMIGSAAIGGVLGVCDAVQESTKG